MSKYILIILTTLSCVRTQAANDIIPPLIASTILIAATALSCNDRCAAFAAEQASTYAPACMQRLPNWAVSSAKLLGQGMSDIATNWALDTLITYANQSTPPLPASKIIHASRQLASTPKLETIKTTVTRITNISDKNIQCFQLDLNDNPRNYISPPGNLYICVVPKWTKKTGSTASADANNILVDDDAYKTIDTNQLIFLIGHEATHIKNNDALKRQLFGTIGSHFITPLLTALCSYTWHKLNPSSKTAHPSASIVRTALNWQTRRLISKAVSAAYRHSQEVEADINSVRTNPEVKYSSIAWIEEQKAPEIDRFDELCGKAINSCLPIEMSVTQWLTDPFVAFVHPTTAGRIQYIQKM